MMIDTRGVVDASRLLEIQLRAQLRQACHDNTPRPVRMGPLTVYYNAVRVQQECSQNVIVLVYLICRVILICDLYAIRLLFFFFFFFL